MKSKSYWIVGASFIPFIIVLYAETRGFVQEALSLGTLLVAALVLLATMLYVWYRFVAEPAQNFLKTIHRAIHGDYRARFSCGRENDVFYHLSQSFNQFMTIMEKQTDELVKNRHLQNQLYENEKIYRSALELTCERVFEADLTHNKLIYGQSAYNRIFPFLKTELYDEIIKSIAVNAIHEDDIKQFLNTFNRANLLTLFNSGGTAEINLEYRQIMKNGEIRWMAGTLIHLSNNGDDSMKAIGYVKNIDERKRYELEVLKQSQKDGLTGLYNKLVTQSLVESYLANDGCKVPNAAIMLDIDNFKGFNDSLGHIQGDAALTHVAEGLQKVFRSTDVVGRIGGDEFFILVKNYGSLDALTEKLDGLCAMFRKIRLGDDNSHPISGSIGVSLYPQDGKNYAELYKKADAALYRAKAKGKDCYHICSQEDSDDPRLEALDSQECIRIENPVELRNLVH